MNDKELPANPYRPSETPLDAVPVGRPGGLTAIAVIAIVLGALGVLTSLFGCVGLIGGAQMQRVFTPTTQPGMPQEMVDLQTEMQEEMIAVTEDFQVFSGGALVFNLAVSVGLLVGGIFAMKLSPLGKTLLIAAAGVGVPLEAGRAVLQWAVQMRVATVMDSYVARMMEATSGGNQGAQEFMGTIMKSSIYVGLGIAIIFFLVKVVFYAVTILYLRHPKVQPLFQKG